MRKIILVPALTLSLTAFPALASESGEHSGMLESERLSAEHVNQKITHEGHEVRHLETHERGYEANDD